ncbi:MAG: hypothetical protein V4555_14915 [Acidobacteriota bacterium]
MRTFIAFLPLGTALVMLVGRLAQCGITFYALRYKDNVAVSFARGKFSLVAMGNSLRKLP